MNLRELLEPAPILAQLGVQCLVPERMDLALLHAHLQLLLQQWERELEWDQSGDQSLAEEIICAEVLTVVIAAVVLASHPRTIFAPLGEKIRASAARHAELRDKALELLEQNSTNISAVARVRRLRRRVSRWIDRLLGPILSSIRDAGGDGEQTASGTNSPGLPMLLEFGLRRVVPNRRIDHPYRAALLRRIISLAVGWLDEGRLPTSGPQRHSVPRWRRELFKKKWHP